ncbi:MAG: hypothetical protein ABIN91_04980 [Mucilaginibacter sp.]|uniref:hypothetical protein n=1 Tax=Mucilaginibacter sp. TaxID=1882438 RepID=UPI0032652640
MRDFSLDLNAEKIHSPKTKEYFNEVIKSYYNESYRSAIVMLYSITLADLLYKLEELQDLYNDTAAKDILLEIKNTQANSGKLSEWESRLVELVNTKTSLFDTADYQHFKSLQAIRNLCAHPVMTDHYELYEPNRETTRAYIRNMLEGILIKPALLSKKIFNDFMQNLAVVKAFFVDPAQLEIHLKAKYFDRFNEKVKAGIFKSLWKVALKINDNLSNEHREVTNQALIIMLKNDYTALSKKIGEEKDYYSDINTDFMNQIIQLFNCFPKIGELMNESTKMILSNKLNEYADLDVRAFYRTPSIEEHMERVGKIDGNSDYESKYVTTDAIMTVYRQAVLEGKKQKGNSFLIQMFAGSFGFDMADNRFTELIEPYLKEFNLEELELVIKAVNENGQICSRRRARTDNYYIKERVLELDKKYSFNKYPNFYL